MSNQPPFQRVGIVCDYVHLETPVFMQTLVAYLEQHQTAFVISEQAHQLFPHLKGQVVPSSELHQHCDLVLAIGGDGSLLRAALTALNNDLPILGINRGHLGFLTALPANDLDRLGPILDGHYIEEKRLLIDAHILDGDKTIHQMRALNDIVLTHTQATHMLEFDVRTQDQLVCQLRADGYIIATPTGSTAYALSAGGPILEPQSNALALVSMMPHSLSNRPLVVNADHVIDIHLNDSTTNALISADGQVQYQFEGAMHCRITKHPHPLRLIHGLDYNYFSNLSDKLSWHNSTKRG